MNEDAPKPQRGYRGPYVVLTAEECHALVEELGTKLLSRPLASVRDKCQAAAHPVYKTMMKPLKNIPPNS